MSTEERQTGILGEWDAAKGYGFVEARPRRLFVHRRAFDRHADPPEEGDLIAFLVGRDAKGRPCAVEAAVIRRSSRRWRGLLVLPPLLVLPGLAIAQAGRWALTLLGVFAFLSLAAFALYRVDKRRALTRSWRIAEAALHLLAAAGGWPGAFVAQRLLRHKVSKPGFQAGFWAIVLLHQLVALDALLGWRGLRRGWALFWN